MLLLPTALAEAPTARLLPWGTVDVLSTVEAGVTFVDGVRPVTGGGVALLAGPALLRIAQPEGEAFSLADAEIHGFSAGFLARLDLPRAAEAFGRTFGGYVRYGHQEPGDDEVRATLGVGWRQCRGGATTGGQLDLLVVAERRIFAPVAVTAQVGAGVGNAALPWRLTAGAGAMIGF